MLKIEMVPLPKGPKLVIEVEDSSPNCLPHIIKEIEDLNMEDGEIVFVEFITLHNPSVAVMIAGYLLEHFHTIAVTEREGWDCFVIAARREDSPFVVGAII